MNKHLASRLKLLGTETAFEVLARAKALEKQGKSIIHFEIGEPDFDTPTHIVEAGISALRNGRTHYTPANGLLEFREEICRHVLRTRGTTILPENVVVTPGAKPIMFFSMLCCINEGDEVIYPNPGFPIYESMIRFVGGVPIPLPLHESRKFRFDPVELEQLITHKTKMIIINSPHNPTGGILTKKEIQSVAELAIKHDLLVLSDEVYDEVLYEGKNVSILSVEGMKDRTILLAGHSKNYAMTGWRLGYGVFPKEIAPMVTKLAVNSVSSTAEFTQMAGIAALSLTQEPTKRMLEEFRRRRDYMVERLNQMGLRCLCPEGAFYVFPSVEGTGMSSKELADYFLKEAGVAVLDGVCFGSYGSGYIRLSYATSMENIAEGMNRMQKSLLALKIGNSNTSPKPNHSMPLMINAVSAPIQKSTEGQWKIFNPTGIKRVLVTKQMPGKRWLEVLIEEGYRVEVGTSQDILSKEEIKNAIGTKCDAVIGQLTEDWGEELFHALSKAGGVAYSNMAVGFDNVKVPIASKYNIAVGNTPGVLTETTAEMAVALTFAAARRIVEADTFMRSGKYKGWLPTMFVGQLLHRKTIGIIGAGRIGAAFAIMMSQGHNMNVLYYDIQANLDLENRINSFGEFLKSKGEPPVICIRASSPEEVFKQADIISLHTVLDSTTRHLINKDRLSMMKETAILVNTSRGPVIDEEALVQHCRRNTQFSAALDVFEREPLMADGLSSLPNVIIVPHIASATQWTRAGMALLAACNVLGVMKKYPLWKGNDYLPFVNSEDIPKATPSIVNAKDVYFSDSKL